uniref:hypothetical protein n=1 Tax=Membranihabitans marinus TaxID=1227546 RepID=UPI001F200334
PPEGIIPRFPYQMPLVGIWLFELHSVTHGFNISSFQGLNAVARSATQLIKYQLDEGAKVTVPRRDSNIIR